MKCNKSMKTKKLLHGCYRSCYILKMLALQRKTHLWNNCNKKLPNEVIHIKKRVIVPQLRTYARIGKFQKLFVTSKSEVAS